MAVFSPRRKRQEAEFEARRLLKRYGADPAKLPKSANPYWGRLVTYCELGKNQLASDEARMIVALWPNQEEETDGES